MSEHTASDDADRSAALPSQTPHQETSRPLYLRLAIKLVSITRDYGPLLGLPPFLAYLTSLYHPGDLSTTCPSRSHDGKDGFIGNSDLYGLGVRLSLYLTWFTATAALLFAPTLRLTIASSYSMVHVGILIALTVLVFRQSCLYIAEMNVLLQLQWAGAALVLAPAPFDDGKKSRDRLFGFIALSGLPVTYWTCMRLFNAPHPDMLETPGGTTLVFLPSSETGKTQYWLVMIISFHSLGRALFALIQKWGDDGKLARRSLMTFSGQLARDFVTLKLATLMDMLFKSAFFFSLMSWWLSDVEVVEQTERREIPYRRKLSTAWHGLRAAVVALVAICSVESVLLANGVSGVHEIGSSGQILPLVLGLLQLVWLGHAMSYETQKPLDASKRFESLKKGSGLQDATGKWL